MKKVLVILGKGILRDGTLTKYAKNSVEEGVKLFKSKDFDILVMSGRWSYSLKYTPEKTEALAMKEYAIQLGVFEGKIIMEEASFDTLGNAYYVQKLLEHMGDVNFMAVVTANFHVQRAQYIFEKIFGNTLKINFVPIDIEVDLARSKEMIKFEHNALKTTVRIFKNIDNADCKKIHFVFEHTLPLYAKDLSLVPKYLWDAYEKKGVSRDFIEKFREDIKKPHTFAKNIDAI